MTQLWAICIWLSSLTPSSIIVSPIAPRSIVVLAPISTSSPIDDRADLRNLDPAPVERRKAETVAADHRTAVDDAARADPAIVQHDSARIHSRLHCR